MMRKASGEVLFLGRKYRPKSCIEKRLKCLKCGNIQTIQRLKNRNRPAGHRKHLYCVVCQDRIEHEEMPMYD